MSSPSFLFANETNHTLLQSLLEALNAIIEHQYQRKCNIFQVDIVIDARKTIPTWSMPL